MKAINTVIQRMAHILRSSWMRRILWVLLLFVTVLSGCTAAFIVAEQRLVPWGDAGDEDARVRVTWSLAESPLPRATPLQWTPDGSRIVFTDVKRSQFVPKWLKDNIYVVASDGSSLRRIVQGAHWPSISPSGFRIAYSYVRSVEAGIISIRTSKLDGSSQIMLEDWHLNLTDGPPSWSPDGSRIAFSKFTMGVYVTPLHKTVYGTPAHKTNVIRVFHFDLLRHGDLCEHTPRWGPVWSPNGETLAFVVAEEARAASAEHYYTSRDLLYTVGADGSAPMRLFATTPGRPTNVNSPYVYIDRIVGSPSWSPDGRRLVLIRSTTNPDYTAFAASDEEMEFDPRTTVYTIEADGSDLRTVAEFSAYTHESSLSWSPSGAEILFTMGDGYVYIVNADSGTYRQVGKGLHASWSPDGSRIAVMDQPSGMDQPPGDYISTIAPDGSDVRVLVRKEQGGDLKVVNR